MASIVDNEKMVGLRVVKKRGHLNPKLNAGVRHRGNMPFLSPISILLLQNLLEGNKILIDRLVLLPPQEQDRDISVWVTFCLPLDEHGSILKMPRKGFKVMSFGKRSRGYLLCWIVLLRLYPELRLARMAQRKLKNQKLTDSWGNCVGGGGLLGVVALTLGANFRFLFEGSIDREVNWSR